MRVPRELLRDTVTVEDYDGSGAHGPLYRDPRGMCASLQGASRLFTDSRGQTITVDTLAIIRPEDGPVRPESKVFEFTSGVEYRVAQCVPIPDARRPAHYELLLTRYAQARGGAGSGSGSGS